jgi:hypothetical protein
MPDFVLAKHKVVGSKPITRSNKFPTERRTSATRPDRSPATRQSWSRF